MPVDFVSRHILLSIPFIIHQNSTLLITSCTSSSLNPTTWSQIAFSLTKYQNQFPYEKRVRPAALNLHKSETASNLARKLKTELPSSAMFYISKVFGSKKSKQTAIQFREALVKAKEATDRFTFFTTNEWVFDSASIHKLTAFLASSKSES